MRLDEQTQLNNLINTDRLYRVEIPDYRKHDDVVLYRFLLVDLTHNSVYECDFRYSELRNVHSDLTARKYKVAQFPESHFWSFWKRTNKDKNLIEQRRYELQYYFNVTLNNPQFRGDQVIKNFVQLCKSRSKQQIRRNSDPSTKMTMSTELKRRSSER